MFAIQEPAGQRLEHLPLERLEHELTRLASDIYAGTCRWLELVAEFDRREAASRLGFRTTAEWIAWRCALSPRTAREHVRVARALGELPAIHAEFSRGALSYAKVKALTRVADRDSEAELLELARYATASQLERLVRAYRRIGTDEARDAHEGEYLAWSWEEDGSLSFRGRLASEDGALLLRALEAGRDRVWRAQADDRSGPAGPPGRNEADTNSAQPGDDGPAGPSSTSSPAARQITNVEALVEMADASLSPGAAHRSGPERYQVVVHVDEATLARDADGRCELEGETGISSETARRLACDSSVVSIVERGGASLRVGRKSRRIPPALARALRVRDGGCQFPGCERRRFADAHHIHHWAKGGETDKDNLLLLCRHHHRLVHEGGFSVERLPDGRVRFRLPTGMPLGASSLPNGDPARLPRSRPDQILTGSGERMDLAMNADRVVQIAGPP
jgi:Domain of unknown function (DUF222)/HNH endonuclease